MIEELRELLVAIESVLGRELRDPEPLVTAVTHRSFVNEVGEDSAYDNERLEFLGDSVLNLIVSDILMRAYPDDDEGALSKYRSAIVNERSLASAARAIDLGRFIRLGKGEELSQGREKDSILANAFEALVAAIYTGGGFSDAKSFVSHHLKKAIDEVTVRPERHDYKTALQEYTQRTLKVAPVYKLVSEDGPDHNKVFESEVWIDGRLTGSGRAKSKKDSEQQGAFEALKALGVELDHG